MAQAQAVWTSEMVQITAVTEVVAMCMVRAPGVQRLLAGVKLPCVGRQKNGVVCRSFFHLSRVYGL